MVTSNLQIFFVATINEDSKENRTKILKKIKNATYIETRFLYGGC